VLEHRERLIRAGLDEIDRLGPDDLLDGDARGRVDRQGRRDQELVARLV
jgi:hypothetical protein